jgi:hypothetical protein
MLADRDLVISAGKMSGLWSGDPASIKLSDLDVICAVLGCGVGELLIPEPGKVIRSTEQEGQAAAAPAAAGPPEVTGATARRALASPRLMAGRKASSCADCLAWGVLNGRRCTSCSIWRCKHPARPGALAAGGSWRSRTVTAGCAGFAQSSEPGPLPAQLQANWPWRW